MKKIQATLFGLIAALVTFSATANPPDKLDELMTPVDGATYDKLYQNNEFSIRQQLYFAKKHRIVKINTDLLMQNSKPFSITPFNEMKFKILGEHKVKPINQQTHIWDGQLSHPRIKTDDEELNQSLNEVTLYLHAGSILHNPENGPLIDGIGQSAQTMQVATKMVNGEIRDRLGKKTVVIYVLPFNPDYNLVYLLDKTKQVGEGYSNPSERSGKLDRFIKELNDEKAKRKQQEKLK
jgi:hypothetical protein